MNQTLRVHPSSFILHPSIGRLAMTLSLRYRIVLTLLPLLALLAGLGGAAIVLLHRLGGSAEAILRQNYDSVIFMQRLNEAVERIDSSFAFAMADQEDLGREQYRTNWDSFSSWLRKEQNNITEPGEGELVDELTRLTERYRRQGDAFYARRAGDAGRKQDYFGTGGLLHTFGQIKQVARRISDLNQESMERASREAKRTARESVVGFGVGLLVVAVLAGALALWMTRAILRPITAVTRSAMAIGAGNLDQVVPVRSRDELGLLADSFNVMARQLRHYRQTDYTRLLRAQRTSQATIDSFPDPVLVVDPEGRVEMANPVAQRLLGVTGARDGQPPMVPWQPPEALREPLRAALQEQIPYLPDSFDRAVPLRSDGQERSYLPRILPIRAPYGLSAGAAVLLEDVTRFRLLDQVKSDLVATASHELKTPLTSLRLAVHLLLEETVGPLTAKQAELLLDARDNAERLLGMVNNLLDLARLERGRENLELLPESPGDLLEATAEAARPRAEDRHLTLAVEVPADLPRVLVDRQRLGHALGNLLDNAVTYTEPGGRVTLSAEAAEGRVVLTVADTGIGIPPEHLPHVFDRFFRVPGRSQQGGTGLGLAIVREIVAAHGGSIRCESQPGVGTVFRLELPAAGDDKVTR
jgi:signal transduction histidine kinase/HAMP domain-containing protein